MKNYLTFLEKYELQKKADISITVKNLKNYEITEEDLSNIINDKVNVRPLNLFICR
jgi:hypothetical protein